jgi:hypothetical protein
MRRIAFGIVAVTLLLAGCTQPTADGTPSPIGGEAPLPTPLPNEELSPEQVAALADGVAETAEYQEGFRRYQACLQAAGYELRDVSEDEYGFINAGIPDAAVQSGVDTECYVGEWKYVDMYWQLANEDNSPSTRFLKACLEELGIEPADTAREIIGQMEEAGISPEDCQ